MSMTEAQMLARIAELEAALTKPAKRRKQSKPEMHCNSCGITVKNNKQLFKHDEWHRSHSHKTLAR